jgi:hypothetical protein
VIHWLQLAVGTVVLLWPGWTVARALGVAGAASGFAWSVGLIGATLALTFAVHGSLTLTLVLVLVAGAVATPFARRREAADGHGLAGVAGLAFGIAMWPIAGIVAGDGLFHLGRMRKLLELGDLHLRTLDEFKDGGLHPGYAFPLWHAWLALVGKVTGLDPSVVLRHESSLLVPLAFVLAYEVGRVVFQSRALGIAALLAQVGMIALAPAGAGAYATLDLPGTSARQLLVPAVTILFFRFVRAPSRAVGVTLAIASTALAFVHPTYGLFLAIVLVGYAAARHLLVREWRDNVLALVAYGVPMALVFAWLKPIVDETVSRVAVAQGLRQYHTDLVVHSPTSYHLAPEVVTRTGSIAIAALVLAPLAVLATRRRWAALVLGATALVLALELAPFLFPHFSKLVSLSQSRRAAGFVPFAVAFAGGLSLLPRALAAPAALAAGIALQAAWPGDFGLRLQHGGPGGIAWWALFGCLAALAVGVARRLDHTRATALAATLFVLPVAAHGFANWDAAPTTDRFALTPGLVRFLRHDVPAGAVVFAGPQTSYRIAAAAPVYVVDGPPTHVADTRANDPYGRVAATKRFFATHDLAILHRYGAEWLVLARKEKLRLPQPLAYRDGSFRVYRLPSAP